MFNKNEFRAQLARMGMSAKTLAEKLGIDESTLYRKINNQGSFTRQEINDMIAILNITNPKIIFFADELAETQD